MRIYFDNAATTPIHPEVIEHMYELMEEVHGNPSSIHHSGRKARTIIEDARKTVAKTLNASIGEIFFTSSATESNNMLIRRAVTDLNVRRIIISSIEHPCVMNTAKQLAEDGNIKLEILKVDRFGLVDVNQLTDLLSSGDEMTLVSIMHVNNEIGCIQDISAISEVCRKHDALFHCDAVQSIGKLSLDLQKVNIDFLSGSAHKFHGPKGAGFMYIKNDHTLQPWMTGGGQERSMRSGTENVHGVAGLAKALEIYLHDREDKLALIRQIKQRFKKLILEAIPDVSFVEESKEAQFIPTILSVSFPVNPKTELITFNLDISGIAASAGSACASGVEQASHVLEAIDFSEDRRAVRFSFSYFNTMDEVERSIELIQKSFS